MADDLTGACDIAAALLPWDEDVLVEAFPGAPPPAEPGLWVRNTQSRTLAVAAARAAVRAAAAGAEAGGRTVLLKKIDTALRGHLGAELDAAMKALGAEEAFVLPAIPAVGRTTVGGVQLLEGVPVHRTPFAEDPLHPIRESSVGVHLERDCTRRSHDVSLAEVRSASALAAAIARGRAEGRTMFVCDAESDDDLDRALAAALERPRPLILAGSLGLGQALRRRMAPPVASRARARLSSADGGILVVLGSLHPTARRQGEALASRASSYDVVDAVGATRAAASAAAVLEQGGVALLHTPLAAGAVSGDALLACMGTAVAQCVARYRPQGLALVGGETAHAVLRALEQPCIRVLDALGPLIVGGELVGGALGGVRVVTKGGSSGDEASLRAAVGWLTGGVA